VVDASGDDSVVVARGRNAAGSLMASLGQDAAGRTVVRLVREVRPVRGEGNPAIIAASAVAGHLEQPGVVIPELNFARDDQECPREFTVWSTRTRTVEPDEPLVDVFPVLIGGLEGFTRRLYYPAAAVRAGVQGIVHLQVEVGKTRLVECAAVYAGLPYGLSEEALAAMVLSRFEPATKDGEPVRVRMVMPVRFGLR
jgi:TonB family protein